MFPEDTLYESFPLGFYKMKHNYYVIPSLENNKTADISYPTWQDANVGTFFFFLSLLTIFILASDKDKQDSLASL